MRQHWVSSQTQQKNGQRQFPTAAAKQERQHKHSRPTQRLVVSFHLEVQAELLKHLDLDVDQLLVQRLGLLRRREHKHLDL